MSNEGELHRDDLPGDGAASWCVTSTSDAAERCAEMIGAFDAANLAWGRFRLETLPRYPAAQQPAVEALRDALGEVAIVIAELLANGDVAPTPTALSTALSEALRLLDRYCATLPAEVPRDDLDAAHDLLAEATLAAG